MPCTTDCGCTSTSIAVLGQREQPRRLDQLEALVHHRGAVDGDLGAHRPDRVAQRRLRRRARHLLAAGGAERAAGGGQHDPLHRAGDCPRPAPGRSRCARNRPAAGWRRPARTARSITSPAQTSASLLASATRRRGADRGQRAGRPAAPVIAAIVQSAGERRRPRSPRPAPRGGLDAGAGQRLVQRRVGRPGRRSRRGSAPSRRACCGQQAGVAAADQRAHTEAARDRPRAGRRCWCRRCRCCPAR